MGSSYTEYRGAGFWSRDQVLQYWLSCVARQLNEFGSKDSFLAKIAEEFVRESQLGGSGCVSPSLDELLADPERIAQVAPFLDKALERLSLYGQFIPKEELNLNEISSLSDWWKDDSVHTESVRKVGRAFIDLLNGRLQPPDGGDYHALSIF
jgi:hypothetical protein